MSTRIPAIFLSLASSLMFISPVSASPSYGYTTKLSSEIPTGSEIVVTAVNTSKGLEIKKTVVSDPRIVSEVINSEKKKPGTVAVSLDSKKTRISSIYSSNDPLVSNQWYLSNPLNMEPVHSQYIGKNTTVGIIDTGTDLYHPDLQGKIMAGPNFVSCTIADPFCSSPQDDNGHGTHLSGTVAASLNNNTGVVGIAPSSKILSVKVLDASGQGWDSDIANGIIYAADQNVSVINLSLGSTDASATEQAAVNYALSKGIPVVAAAGNILDGNYTPRYPAAYPGVIATAATNTINNVPYWSNKQSYVSVAAPGDSIYNTTPNSSYGYESGTSMSSAIVSGVVALMRERYPNITPSETKSLLEIYTTDLGTPGYDTSYGYGLINPYKSIMGTTSVAPPDSPQVKRGIYTVTSKGLVLSYAGAVFYGDMSGIQLNKPIVGFATTKSGNGYWLVASDGGIFSFGDAQFYGSMGGKTLNKPIVGMSATKSGNGYWLVASDGGIFSYGDAQFYGSMVGKSLNKPMVGISSTKSGNGYWTVASDGGIFSYGDAQFYGSMGGEPLNKPMLAMTSTITGKGYWMVSSDGGIFTFGDAQFYGSILSSFKTVGIDASPSGNGYATSLDKGIINLFGDSVQYANTSGWILDSSDVVAISFVA